MKELIVYEFEGCTFSPVPGPDGEPWFFATDVAKILRFKDVGRQVRRLPDSEKGRTDSPTLGGNQQVQIVSELGLYKLCFASRSPFALKFQDWVANLVKQVRIHGFYVDERQLDKVPDDVVRAWTDRFTVAGHSTKGGLMIGKKVVIARQGTPIGTLSFEDFKKQMRRKG